MTTRFFKVAQCDLKGAAMAERATSKKSSTRRRRRSIAATGDALATLEPIERCIHLVRSQRVMLDRDLAAFYEVETKALNRAVKRNWERFPFDFCFQLTAAEFEALRCQIGTSNVRGGTRYRPYAFTEHGAMMAASMLNSARAVQMSVLVVRAFVRLRHILISHTDLARRIAALEREFANKTAEHEQHIQRIYEILDELMNPPESPAKGRIGFAVDTARTNGSLR